MAHLSLKYIGLSALILSLSACQNPQNPTGYFPYGPYGPYGQRASVDHNAQWVGANHANYQYSAHQNYPLQNYPAQNYSSQNYFGQYPYGHNAHNARQSYGRAPHANGSPYGYNPRQTQRRGGINVNYETANFVEAPLAYEAGDVTFELRGRIDAPLSYSLEYKDKAEADIIGNYQISAETQLPNRITVGAVYGGNYEREYGSGWNYDDELAVYAGGSWGTVFGGNVSDLVFENTRRRRGVTPVRLPGDGPLGEVEDWSGGYQGRYGPTQISALVDGGANYDVGISYQRPVGHHDYRFTARHNKGEFVAADGFTVLDTVGANVVGEIVFGSTRFDVGAGYERIDEADRWYTSSGLTTKRGAWSLSAEGRYGHIEGQNEIGGVLGLRYDMARGLSSTLALDYQDAQVNINGVDYLNTKDTRIIAGLSYGF